MSGELRLPEAVTWTEVDLGRNTSSDVPGVVLVETSEGREELMVLEAGDESQQVLLSMRIYDADGSEVAKLHHNILAPKEAGFVVTTSASSVTLTEKRTERVVVEVIVLDRERVQVLQADLYTPSGDRLAIRPDRLIFRLNTFAGHQLEGHGQDVAIMIGPRGFSLSATWRAHPSWQEESSSLLAKSQTAGGRRR
jgi:hypothetical protein